MNASRCCINWPLKRCRASRSTSDRTELCQELSSGCDLKGGHQRLLVAKDERVSLLYQLAAKAVSGLLELTRRRQHAVPVFELPRSLLHLGEDKVVIPACDGSQNTLIGRQLGDGQGQPAHYPVLLPGEIDLARH